MGAEWVHTFNCEFKVKFSKCEKPYIYTKFSGGLYSTIEYVLQYLKICLCLIASKLGVTEYHIILTESHLYITIIRILDKRS